MKRQDSVSPKIISKELSKFLRLLETKDYANHGKNEFIKKRSAQLVRRQQISLESERSEVWFDTSK